jgi:hypothetical protein
MITFSVAVQAYLNNGWEICSVAGNTVYFVKGGRNLEVSMTQGVRTTSYFNADTMSQWCAINGLTINL